MPSELAFRAQLILREQRALYGYWRSRAHANPIPLRYDIDPVDIPHLLPSLSLLDSGADLSELRYRLAGTRVREIYGTEITGRTVFESGLQLKQEYWHSVYRSVMEGTAMQGAVRGPITGREHLVLVWMRLPLSGLSGAVERVLGYDAALPASFQFPPEPSWAADAAAGPSPVNVRRSALG
jgi:hypothetical protein